MPYIANQTQTHRDPFVIR